MCTIGGCRLCASKEVRSATLPTLPLCHPPEEERQTSGKRSPSPKPPPSRQIYAKSSRLRVRIGTKLK